MYKGKEIRLARVEDLDEIVKIYDFAKGFMVRTGNPTQWAGSYPQRELLEETGLFAQPDTRHAAVIEYPISPVARKQVVFFPAQVSGVARIRPGEIQRVKWICEEELPQHLFPDTVAACKKLIAHIDNRR